MTALTTPTVTSTWVSWVRLLRPKQWTKNALVFAAPLGAGVLADWKAMSAVGQAFIAFCMAASAMYLVNDAMDVERDRVHPTKKLRPIAAGNVTPRQAFVVAAALVVGALALAAHSSALLAYVVAIYLALTLAYSLRLKHLAVIDIMIVASGFVLRAIAGGVIADVPLSSWFLLVICFGALFIAAGKRYAELMAFDGNGGRHRPSLDGYSLEYLRHVLTLSTGLALITYCLWAFEVPSGRSSELLLRLSIVPFAAAFLRYSMIVFNGHGGEPEEILLRDRQLLVMGVIWVGVFAAGIGLG